MLKKFGLTHLIAALALTALASFTQAQPGGAIQSITPLTRDLGVLRTLSAQVTGTVTSADQTGYNVSRVVCLFNQTTTAAVPATTFAIQNKDAASGQYYTLISSAAIATAAQTVFLGAGAGVPSTTSVSSGLPIARTWRVSATVGGNTTSTVTGTIGCSVQ